MYTINTNRMRVAGLLVAFAAVLALASLGTLGSLSAQAAGDDEVKQADVVVQFDDHDVIIRPITFTGEISGLRALELSGLEIITESFDWGIGLCAVEGVGCPADSCFTCNANEGWGYWYWDHDDWKSYPVGQSGSIISQTGAVEGYRRGRWADELKPAPAPDVQAAQRGLAWLQEQQSATDGSYGGNVSPNLEVMLAIGANHLSAVDWRREQGAPSLMDFVAAAGAGYSKRGVSESGKLGAAAAAADGCWPFESVMPGTYYSATLGSMSDQAGFLSWGVLGTLAISEPVPADSVNYLRGLALPDGGWEWSPGWGGDTNSTAIAIQALIAGGVPVSATEIVSGLAYLKSTQNEDGGFPYQPESSFGTDSDSNSTAWIVQALAAAGEDPRSPYWESASEASPIDFLLSTQLADGSFEYQKGMGSDGFATRQVIQALLGSAHPMEMRELQTCAGTLAGTIVDAKGDGISGATVSLDSGVQAAMLDASAYMTVTVTGADGGYRFEGVPSGNYRLAATLPGESLPSQIRSVSVGVGRTTEMAPIDATERNTFIPSVNRD